MEKSDILENSDVLKHLDILEKSDILEQSDIYKKSDILDMIKQIQSETALFANELPKMKLRKECYRMKFRKALTHWYTAEWRFNMVRSSSLD